MKSLYLRLFVMYLGIGMFGGAPLAIGEIFVLSSNFVIGPARYAEVKVTMWAINLDGSDSKMKVASVTQGEHGTVTISADRKKVRYSAGAGFNGRDSFTYTLTDGVSRTTATMQVYGVSLFKGLHALTIDEGKHAGRGEVSVTATGYVTGKLVFGRRTYRLRGSMDALGRLIAYDYSLGNQETAIFLDLAPAEENGGVNSVSGRYYPNFIKSSKSHDIVGTPASAGGEHTGSYTVVLPRTSEEYYDMPAGTGWAKMIVNPSGRVSLAGKLADGAAFSSGSQLDINQQYFLYAAGSAGLSLGGYVRFEEVAGESDCDGELWWARGKAKNRAHRAGFEGPVNFLGSRFTVPGAGETFLGLRGTSAVDVSLSGGNLSADLLGAVQISPLFNATPTASVSALFAEYTAPASSTPTGVFFGTFMHPDLKANRGFSGVFFQKGNRAEGFFIGSTETGRVILSPQSVP